MNDLPPASTPAPQPGDSAPPYVPPPAVPPQPYAPPAPQAAYAPQPAPQPYSQPAYAPPLSAASAPPSSTPPWMGARGAAGTPPPAGPGVPPVYPGYPNGGAPADYKTAGTFLLIGSVTTLIVNLIVVLLTIWFCIGVCWLPLVGLALWGLVSGIQAMNGTRVRNIRVANALALVAALFCADLIGIVMQILALVWLSKPEVSRFLDEAA